MKLRNLILTKFFRQQKVRNKINKTPNTIDKWLFIVTVVLTLFGLLMVYESSVTTATREFNNQYYFLQEQLKWVMIGFVSLIIFSRINYHIWYKISLPLLVLTLFLLIAVFIPGLGIRALGSYRWLNFGFFVFQPAEIAKFSLIIYLSAWFSYQKKRRFTSFFILLSLILGLVMLEPDLGTSIIILLIALYLYFLSGVPIYHFLLLAPILVVAVLGLSVVSPYRFRRLTTFFDPQNDPLGASYQIRQVLLALGSGGLLGVGLGNSRQKYAFLPEAYTDSIFAIVGEEIGWVGTTVFIFLIVFLVWRGFRIAKSAPDEFGRFVACGITFWIAIQAVINLSAMVSLIPLTGVPLPLISYGGSSLIVILTGLGIVLNIGRHKNK